jgi:hypothetical protein
MMAGQEADETELTSILHGVLLLESWLPMLGNYFVF